MLRPQQEPAIADLAADPTATMGPVGNWVVRLSLQVAVATVSIPSRPRASVRVAQPIQSTD
jgi:hypothetical protein